MNEKFFSTERYSRIESATGTEKNTRRLCLDSEINKNIFLLRSEAVTFALSGDQPPGIFYAASHPRLFAAHFVVVNLERDSGTASNANVCHNSVTS